MDGCLITITIIDTISNTLIYIVKVYMCYKLLDTIIIMIVL